MAILRIASNQLKQSQKFARGLVLQQTRCILETMST